MSAAGTKMARSQTLSPEEREVRIQNIAYLIQVSLDPDTYKANPAQPTTKENDNVTSDAPRT